MKEETKYNLTPEQIKAINAVTSRGDRVEIIPVKDGLKILKIKREQVKGIYI